MLHQTLDASLEVVSMGGLQCRLQLITGKLQLSAAAVLAAQGRPWPSDVCLDTSGLTVTRLVSSALAPASIMSTLL